MDGFLDLFWNLDQISGWAETRDPELVRAAALPKYGMPKKTLEISVRSTHTAADIRRSGRDVDAELWAASGWPPPESRFTVPRSSPRMPKNTGSRPTRLRSTRTSM
jgi:hypothetical protein